MVNIKYHLQHILTLLLAVITFLPMPICLWIFVGFVIPWKPSRINNKCVERNQNLQNKETLSCLWESHIGLKIPAGLFFAWTIFFHWRVSPSLEFGLQTISLVLAPQMVSHLSVSSNDLPRTSQTKQSLSISRSKVDHGWEWSTPVDHLWSTPICPIISNHPSVWLIWSLILTNIQSQGALNYNSSTAGANHSC